MTADNSSTSSGDEGISVSALTVGSRVSIEVAGELDLGAGSHWEQVVTAVLASIPTQIDVDLEHVSFMDSSGLSLLIELLHWADAHGARLRLHNVPHNVRRILEFAGATELFEMSAVQLEPD